MSWLRAATPLATLLSRAAASLSELSAASQPTEQFSSRMLAALQLEQRRWMAVPKRKVLVHVILCLLLLQSVLLLCICPVRLQLFTDRLNSARHPLLGEACATLGSSSNPSGMWRSAGERLT